MAGTTVTHLFRAGLRAGNKAQAALRPENPLFDRDFYARTYPEVVEEGVDLYEHYSRFGWRNGFDPNAYFDSDWYETEYPDVAATGANPLDHYLDRGAVEGRNPSPAFSSWLYLMLYPDVRTSGMNPLLHFLLCGRGEGRLAPPIHLMPAVTTMREPIEGDVPRSADALATITLLREWFDKLLVARPIASEPSVRAAE